MDGERVRWREQEMTPVLGLGAAFHRTAPTPALLRCGWAPAG